MGLRIAWCGGGSYTLRVGFRVSVLWFCVLALAGCETAGARLINGRRAAVGAKLDQIQSLRARLGTIPPAAGGKISLGQAPLVMAVMDDAKFPTGTVVYEQALADLRRVSDVAPHYNQRIRHAKLLEECGTLIARDRNSPPLDIVLESVKLLLTACENIQYVFVLRTAKMTGREFVGDVVAFEVATGRHMGGFPLAITSEGRTDQVRSETRTVTPGRVGSRARGKITTKSTTSAVNADADQLRSELAEEVEAAIKELVPGVLWVS